jgi:hypothetical protein
VPYNADATWDGVTHFYGASLSALERLGRRHGYSLAACDSSGINAFFNDSLFSLTLAGSSSGSQRLINIAQATKTERLVNLFRRCR